MGKTDRNDPCPCGSGRKYKKCCLAHALIMTARTLYSNEPFGIDLQQTVYALDATTIDLCLSMFPWAPFRQSKAAILRATKTIHCDINQGYYLKSSLVANSHTGNFPKWVAVLSSPRYDHPGCEVMPQQAHSEGNSITISFFTHTVFLMTFNFQCKEKERTVKRFADGLMTVIM